MDNRTPKPTEYLLYNRLMKRYETYEIMISWLDAYHFNQAEAFVKTNQLKTKEGYLDGKTIAELP